MRPLVADTSHYSPPVTPEMLRGFSMVIAKGGGNENPLAVTPFDPDFAGTVEAAWHTPRRDGRVGIPAGMYWFINPRVYLDRGMQGTAEELGGLADARHPVLPQIEQALRAGNQGWKAVSSLWFDVEEASLRLHNPGVTITPRHIRDMLADLHQRIRSKMARGEWPRLVLGVYSRKSWFTQYDPQRLILDWIAGQPELAIWTADYRVYRQPAFTSGLDIREEPRSWLRQVPESFGECAGRGKAWHLWQFWGSGWADLNLYNGNEEELLAWLDYRPREAPAPVGEPVPGPAGCDAALTRIEGRLTAMDGKLDQILKQGGG